jgi:hypothetical protein
MHKKEFWILTIKCENKLEHESLVFMFKLISTFIGQNPNLLTKHVLTKDVLLL